MILDLLHFSKRSKNYHINLTERRNDQKIVDVSEMSYTSVSKFNDPNSSAFIDLFFSLSRKKKSIYFLDIGN